MTRNMPLKSATSAGTVDNAVIFISDSVRYDSLPQAVRNQGITAQAVAPSTFTGSSIPSILTGQYPSKHQVWSFEDKLNSLPPLFTGLEDAAFDYDEEFHLQPETIGSPSRRPLEELDSPFVYIYHDRGGHFPYGESFESYDNMHSFFEEYQDPAELRDLYHQSVSSSASRFVDLVNSLEEEGELENTLVIFISDHGEILGEHGRLFTHAVPMVPELVEVPIVFAGAGLPSNEDIDTLLSGTDVVPTVHSALGRTTPKRTDGADLWKHSPDVDRLVRSEVWKQTKYEWLKSYIAGSAWDKNGGYVTHTGSWFNRLIYSCGVHLLKGPHSSLARNLSVSNYWKMLKAHLPSKVQYGHPDFDFQEALEVIPEFEQNTRIANHEVDQERLKQLGYLE